MIYRTFPLSVNVVLHNQCNLKCPVCPYHGLHTPPYFLKEDVMRDTVADRLLVELPGSGAAVKFGEFEEPLLYEGLVKKLIVGLHDRGVNTHVTTNGLLLDKYINEVSRLDSVYVSIDAATEETYKKVRGGSFQKVVMNVLELKEQFKGQKLGVSFIRQPDNQHEEQQFVDFWLPLVDCVIIYSLLKFNGQTWAYDIPDPFRPEPAARFVCENPFVDTFILPNGNVTLCCETLLMSGRERPPVMGNIQNKNLSEIWNGAKYDQVRMGLLTEYWQKTPVCEKCRLWQSWKSETTEANGVRTTMNYTTKIVERIK